MGQCNMARNTEFSDVSATDDVPDKVVKVGKGRT